jgi:hypothetical protein
MLMIEAFLLLFGVGIGTFFIAMGLHWLSDRTAQRETFEIRRTIEEEQREEEFYDDE